MNPLLSDKDTARIVLNERASRTALVVACLVGVGFFAIDAVMLDRMIFHGRAHGGDTVLYARGLWGLGRGELFNPFYHQPTLAVHAHLLGGVLAPLTWVMSSARVLCLAQAVSLGTTTAVFAYHVSNLLLQTRQDTRRTLHVVYAALLASLLVVSCVPLLNPFFFDPRPDLLGVPFLATGLLGAVGRGGIDKRALAWMAISVLAREEFGVIVAAALMLSPCAPSLGKRTRILGALAGVIWLVGYHLIVHSWVGGSRDTSVAFHLQGAFAAVSLRQLLEYKLEIALAVLLSGAGFALTGWRWLGAALPGVAFLLITRWMPEATLRVHYGMFAAPGLLAAVLAGLKIHFEREHGKAWWIVRGVAAIAIYFVFGNGPFSRKFDAIAYDWRDTNGALRPRLFAPVYANHAKVHARLAALDPNEPIAAASYYSARLADREEIYSLMWYVEALKNNLREPPRVDTVVVDVGAGMDDLGRFLVRKGGFRLQGYLGAHVEVLTRVPARMVTPWKQVGHPLGSAECQRPLAKWQAAGLALCEVQSGPQRTRVWVSRTGAPRDARFLASSALELRLTGNRPVRARLFRGLADFSDIPVGWVVAAEIDGPIGDKFVAGVVNANGNVLPPD